LKLNSSKSGLAGILIIVMVLSTLLVISLRRKELGSPVYLAKNEYPAQFKSTQARGETMIFNFGIICKEPFQELELRYANLFMIPQPEFVDPNFVANNSDPKTIMEERKDIRAIRRNLGNVTIPFDVLNVSARIGNLSSWKEYTGVVYDFSRTLGLFLNHSVLQKIFVVYAVLKSDDGDVLYFGGVPDFFYRRSENVKYISIHYNQNETAYQEKTEIATDVTPVERAPRAGTLIFRNAHRDDQIFVQVNVESRLGTLPYWILQNQYRRYMVHYIRVYANGRLEVNKFNVIPFESGGWSL